MKKLFGLAILLSVMGLIACSGSGTNTDDDCDDNAASCQTTDDGIDVDTRKQIPVCNRFYPFTFFCFSPLQDGVLYSIFAQV